MSSILAGKPVASPKQFAYRWGGKLVSLDDTWINDGSGSGVFRPTIRLGDNPKAIVITSLAPQLNIDSLITYLEKKVESFGGVLSEPSPDDLVSISILLRKGHDFNALKSEVAKRIRSRVDFTFLYIDQFDDGAGGEVDFRPCVKGPLVFLKEWISWRRTVVAGAATYRIGKLRADTLRQQLMIKVIEHRKALLDALDQHKDDADLRRRVRGILKCSDEDANIVLEIRFRKLAKLEVVGLREKIAANAIMIKDNAAIVKSPDARLMGDAGLALKALADTHAEAAELKRIQKTTKHVVKKRKKRYTL
jgi:DNA gyrase/topoisomerase IV subunit A